MTEEPSAGVTEHPLVAMLLLGVSACGAYVLHAMPVAFGLDHGFFQHHGAVRAATFLAVAAAVAFPVYVARPLLAVAMPVWGRTMVWTLYGAASLAAYGPELRHRAEAVSEFYVIRTFDGQSFHEIKIGPAMGVRGEEVIRLRDELGTRARHRDMDAPCAEAQALTILERARAERDLDAAMPDPAADPEAFERAVMARTQMAADEAARDAARQDGRCVVIIRKGGPVHFSLPPDVPRE